MSILNAQPQVWAAEILRALNTILVYAGPNVINRDYEGDISTVGDSVRIITIGDVTVNSYTRDADINTPEALTDAMLTLAIDQQKYFNFAVDDIDKLQAKPNVMAEATRRAAYWLQKTIDSFLAGLYTDVDTGNVVGSDATPTHGLKSEEAYNNLVELSLKLDETDTPEEGRFAVVPPFIVAALLKDPRFVSFGTPANRANLERGMGLQPNGLVGQVAGFNVYQSNQVANTTQKKYKVIAGYPGAWSYAEQLKEVVAFRPERRFSDALKGLVVYGAKVLRPSQMALLTTNNET